jgi:hypothetical protein
MNKSFIIDYKSRQEKSDKLKLPKKIDLLQKIIETFEGYKIPVKKELINEMHDKGIKATFVDNYINKYGDTFPPYMNNEQKLKAGGVDLEPLETLEKKYNSIVIPFDPIDMKIDEFHDYNVYLTDKEEIERYKLAEATAEALNKYIEHHNIKANVLVNSLPTRLFRDLAHQDNKVIPSKEPLHYKKANLVY